jgi:hypothetical protein
MIPLDLDRLAVRIETLVNTSTNGWEPAAASDMRRLLPDASDAEGRLRLPQQTRLRDAAKGKAAMPLAIDYQRWLRACMDLEHHVSRNRPGSPSRMMRDAMRGRFPLPR